MKIVVDVLKVNIPCKDTFSDEVVVHFYMLCLSMEDEGSSKMDIAEIVTVEKDWIDDGDIKILQYPLESYGFTCNNNCALVFGLCNG